MLKLRIKCGDNLAAKKESNTLLNKAQSANLTGFHDKFV